MHHRKKILLDGMDREILRILYFNGPLVTREIAYRAGLSAPAARSRLENLRKKKIIKIRKISKIRRFKRGFEKGVMVIKAPRFILWDLDLKEECLKENQRIKVKDKKIILERKC